jgi:hypothetical protein
VALGRARCRRACRQGNQGQSASDNKAISRSGGCRRLAAAGGEMLLAMKGGGHRFAELALGFRGVVNS